MRRHIAAAALAALLSGAAGAAPPETPELPDPGILLRGLVDEAQVSAVFDYLRNALIAAAEGRDGPVPEILRRELDRIDADVKLRGTLAGLLLLKQLEAQVRSLLVPPPREPALPGTAPYQRT
jgi:hypothetical protein